MAHPRELTRVLARLIKVHLEIGQTDSLATTQRLANTEQSCHPEQQGRHAQPGAEHRLDPVPS